MCVCVCLRFICIYPVYINSKKTLAEGRRIPTEKVAASCCLNCVSLTDRIELDGTNIKLPPYSECLCLCVQAVENPSCTEIRDVLTAAGLNVFVEVRGTECVQIAK